MVSAALNGDLGDLLVVHIYDLHAFRHILAVEPDAHFQAIYPGAAFQGVHLLQIGLAVDLNLVGLVLIGRDRKAGDESVCPAAAAVVDVFGGCQDALRNLLFMLRQARRDGDLVDAPTRHQVAPQCHFGGVVRLLHIVQPQLFQAAVGVSIAHNAHDLGVWCLLFRKIFNGFSNPYLLRHPIRCGVDTIGGNLLGLPSCMELKIHIIKFLHPTIDS